jgi:hypothetical protein
MSLDTPKVTVKPLPRARHTKLASIYLKDYPLERVIEVLVSTLEKYKGKYDNILFDYSSEMKKDYVDIFVKGENTETAAEAKARAEKDEKNEKEYAEFLRLRRKFEGG